MVFLFAAVAFMILSVILIDRITGFFGLTISRWALALCAVMALTVNFSAILLSAYLTLNHFLLLFGMVLFASAVVTAVNELLMRRDRRRLAVAGADGEQRDAVPLSHASGDEDDASDFSEPSAAGSADIGEGLHEKDFAGGEAMPEETSRADEGVITESYDAEYREPEVTPSPDKVAGNDAAGFVGGAGDLESAEDWDGAVTHEDRDEAVDAEDMDGVGVAEDRDSVRAAEDRDSVRVIENRDGVEFTEDIDSVGVTEDKGGAVFVGDGGSVGFTYDGDSNESDVDDDTVESDGADDTVGFAGDDADFTDDSDSKKSDVGDDAVESAGNDDAVESDGDGDTVKSDGDDAGFHEDEKGFATDMDGLDGTTYKFVVDRKGEESSSDVEDEEGSADSEDLEVASDRKSEGFTSDWEAEEFTSGFETLTHKGAATGGTDTRDEAAEPHAEPERSAAKAAVDMDSFTTLDDFLDAAYEKTRLGHYTAAVRIYREAINRFGGDPYAPFLVIEIGTIYKETGDYAGAVAAYERALALPALRRDSAMRTEFRKSADYLRKVRDVVTLHGKPRIPFGDIPPEWLSEIS